MSMEKFARLGASIDKADLGSSPSAMQGPGTEDLALQEGLRFVMHTRML